MDPMRTSHHPPHPPPLSTGPRVEQNHHPTQQPTWRTSPESRSSHLSGPASRNDHSPPGPADYGARHQRHVSHSDAGYRQWSSGPSNSFSGPSPTGSTSYDKRRNSYGSTAPQGHVDPYLPAPHDVEVDSPSRTVRRESHDILHQPQQHLASGGGRLGGSPPSLYRGPADSNSVSSGSPFGVRHMPPPSSPKQYQQNPNYPPPSSRGPLPGQSPTSSFSTSRDLPSISSAHRPGSSMSISSMLGTDAQRPRRDTAIPSSRPFAAIPASSSPGYHPMPASSPIQGSTGYSRYGRPQSPDRYEHNGPREHRANSAGSSTVPSFGTHDRFNHTSSHQPPTYSPASQGQATPMSPKGRATYANQDFTSTPVRPSSQPARQRDFPSYSEDRIVYTAPTSRKVSMFEDVSKQSTIPDEHSQVMPGRNGSRSNFDPVHTLPHQQGQHSSHRDGRPPSPLYNGSNPQQPGSLHDPRQGTNRPGFDSQRDGYASSPKTSQSLYSDRSMHSTDGNYRAKSPHIGYSNPTPRHPTDSDSRLASMGQDQQIYITNGSYSYAQAEQQQRRDAEELQQSRAHLGVGSDGKRGGRLSPLPQAVQGAQGQISGPGGEPGIKSEFGRMFSGIGSGVGSAMSTAGSTSNALSLTAHVVSSKDDPFDVSPPGGPIDGADLKITRTGSRGGRRGKRVKQEEGRVDSESGDGRATPGMNGGGGKRGRHAHHHHHHQHPHHHHHHHHNKGDDELISLNSMPSKAFPAAPGDPAYRPSTPQSTSGQPATTHHHHHHHHHHHTGKVTPLPTPDSDLTVPPPKTTITVLSQNVINSVSHIPRHHLGSTLYSPRLSVATSPQHSKFGFASTPRPFPRFDGKENCTFTIRVPQYYLFSDNREEIVRRRALWGTAVYTDDSDVIAAAVHDGWIRGAWAEEIDISLLDLGSGEVEPTTETNGSVADIKSKDSSNTLTAPPANGPMIPPPGKDVHITLLILPALQSYASTVARGVRSRAWGDNHDGMSFKIEKIEWADAHAAVADERGGEGRRKRMRGCLNDRKDVQGVTLRTDGDQGLGHATWAVRITA